MILVFSKFYSNKILTEVSEQLLSKFRHYFTDIWENKRNTSNEFKLKKNDAALEHKIYM